MKILPMSPNRLSMLALIGLASWLTNAAHAQNIYWQGGTGDFNVATNWVGGVVPGPGTDPVNDSGSNNIVVITNGDPTWTVNDIRAGDGANASGSYIQYGDTVNVGNAGGWFRLGDSAGAIGYYTIYGGNLNMTGGNFHVGESGSGVLNIFGGTITSGPVLDIGDPGTGSVLQTNGTVTINNQMFVANSSTAVSTYTLSGGSLNVHNWFVLGRSGGSGTMFMTGGTFTMGGNGGNFDVGTGFQGTGVGVMNQSGGTLIINNGSQFLCPETQGGTGTYNLSGTGVMSCNNWIAIGRGGPGILNISGGTIMKTDGNGDHFDVGAGGSAAGSGPGTINQTGGTITNTTSDFWLGELSAGTWNLDNGTDYLGNLFICEGNGITGTLNLNGGQLTLAAIASPAGVASSSTLSFGGGVLQASANNPSFISGLSQALVGPGGANIDSQGFTITVPQALLDNNGGAATLTKDGSGTLTLSGANTYGGATTINGGVLKVSTASSASGAVVAANTAGFGTISTVANNQLTVASLTMGGATGGSLNFDLGSFGNPTVAPLNVTGTFTANGTFTVNIAASVVAVGTLPLVQYGSLAGTQSFVLGTLPSGVLAHLATVGNTLELVVTSAGAPRWEGNITGAWDLGTNQDWFDLGTLLATAYRDGEPVVFDDNASNAVVDVTATVSPASINFNNNVLPYTVVGNGKISGSIGLNINGTTNVAMLNTGGNNFTGPVLINSGALIVTNLVNGGLPSPLGASSASPTNLVITSGALSYSGAPVAVNRGFTVNATNSTIDAEASFTLSGQVAALDNLAQNGSAFVKVGPAQLALTGSFDNEFSVNYIAGINVVVGTLVLDGSAGNQTNHTPNQLWVGSTVETGASLILTNTTMHVGDWLGLGRINGGINNTSTLTLYNSTLTLGNMSLGWDGGLPNNLSSQFLTLNNSTLTNFGNNNLAEGVGSTFTMSLNSNSVFSVQNPLYICLAADTTGMVEVADSGQIVENNGWIDIAEGASSIGTLILKNSSSLNGVGDFNVTDTGAGANATVTVQDNASLHANNLWVGKAPNSIATLTITNNATVLSSNGLTMATFFDGTPEVTTANVYLSGGSLAVNLVQGNIVSGVNYGIFNFNGGTLIARNPIAANFMFNLASINVLAGGAVIDSSNSTIAIAQPLLDGGTGGGLTKLGSGTLYLNGVNTYTGRSTVSAGALGGIGTIAGPVTVASGAALTVTNGAGATTGTLTINNTLNLSAGSATFLKLGSGINDQIAGLTGVTYGGALVVSNTTGAPLEGGSVYQLFASLSAGAGNFSSVAVLPYGAATFNPATGQLTITAIPVVSSTTISGGNLIVQGAGGTPGGTYSVLTSTNVVTPLPAWTTNVTGVFGGTGTFSNGIPINTSEPARFFRVKTP